MIEELVQDAPATGDVITQEPEQAPQAVEQAAPQLAPVSKSKEENMRELRLQAERLARERDEFAARLAQYERAPQQQEQEDTSFDVPENDELVDNKTVSKVNKHLRKEMAEIKRQLEYTKAMNGESRFKIENPDWEKVMSLENIQTLSTAYPEMAKMINATTDVYEKAKTAYTVIKRFGIYDENPFEADKQRAIANTAKPRPLTSISPQQGDTPLSRANAFDNGFTPELRNEMLKEMNKARKNY